MKFKLIMENWRKNLNESQWDPADIIEAFAGDHGFDVNQAPSWMKAAANLFGTGKQAAIFSAFINEDDEMLFHGGDFRIGKVYHTDVIKKIQKFVQEVSAELGIPTPESDTLEIIPVTRIAYDILRRQYPEQTSDNVLVADPTLILPKLVGIYSDLLEEAEDDIFEFLERYTPELHRYAEREDYSRWETWENPAWDLQANFRDLYDDLLAKTEEKLGL